MITTKLVPNEAYLIVVTRYGRFHWEKIDWMEVKDQIGFGKIMSGGKISFIAK